MKVNFLSKETTCGFKPGPQSSLYAAGRKRSRNKSYETTLIAGWYASYIVYILFFTTIKRLIWIMITSTAWFFHQLLMTSFATELVRGTIDNRYTSDISHGVELKTRDPGTARHNEPSISLFHFMPSALSKNDNYYLSLETVLKMGRKPPTGENWSNECAWFIIILYCSGVHPPAHGICYVHLR